MIVIVKGIVILIVVVIKMILKILGKIRILGRRIANKNNSTDTKKHQTIIISMVMIVDV